MSLRTRCLGVLGAVAVAVALRAPGLQREISHDEAYSWLAYASVSYAQVLTAYNVPNNHILHSAAMRAAAQMLGGHEEWVLRLPAFAAGIATIPVSAGLAATALASPAAGVAAAWLVALHPVQAGYTQSARGYSLLVLWSTLTWWAGLLALAGRRGMWFLFAIAGFLATMTLPSAVFLIIGVGAWSAVTAWRRGDRRTLVDALLATGLTGAAILLGHARVLTDMTAASERWGVHVWQDVTAALTTLVRGGEMLVGGWMLVGPVMLGVYRLHRRRDDLLAQALLLMMVPVVFAVVTGVAGQARSYFGLLPIILVLAVAWVPDPGPPIRWLGALLCVAAFAVGGFHQAGRIHADKGLAIVARALNDQPPNELLVAPLFLEVPLDYYTRAGEKTRLERVLSDGRLDGLLFARLDTDPRAGFNQYVLFDDRMNYALTIPEAPFTEVYRHGDLSLMESTDGRSVYPRDGATWEVIEGRALLRMAPSAFGPRMSLGFLSDEDGFLAIEDLRFASNSPGFVAVTYAYRGAQVLATLCSQDDGRWREQPAYSGQAISLRLLDALGNSWVAENRLAPVEPGRHYSLCITGEGAGERYVSGLLYTFFPMVAD